MAGKIPQSFIDDLLARVDIVEVVDAHVPLRKAGKNHKARCPFHEEKTPSFTVVRDKQFYHCFGCGANGTAISFLMEYGGLGFIDAIEELAKRCGLEVPRDASYQAQAKQYDELYELLESAAKFYQRQLRDRGNNAIDYLKERGMTGEVAGDYEIGYAPPGWNNLINALGRSEAAQARLFEAGMTIRREDGGRNDGGYYDRFRDRIIFPIRDQRGRVIGFGGRALGDGAPKYLNSPETPIYHKGRELYGLYQARNKAKQPERLYVVEGYTDVIALAQHGVTNAVATSGTAVTENQLEKLFRVSPRVIFCFDGDEAGQKAAWRALEITLPHLGEGRQAHFNFMPEGDDPDSFVRKHGPEKFQSNENIVPFSDFLLDSLKAKVELSTREGRANFLDFALPYLAKMPESGLRQLLLRDVAGIAEIEAGGIDKLLQNKLPGAPARQRKPRLLAQKQNRKLIGDIISYILSKPELAVSVEDTAELSDIPIAGVDFLIELITLIHSNPAINCAAILEHWRDSRYEQRLSELAPDPDALAEEAFDLDVQFLDAMEKLKANKAKHSIEKITQVNPSELTGAQKAKLRQWYSVPNKK